MINSNTSTTTTMSTITPPSITTTSNTSKFKRYRTCSDSLNLNNNIRNIQSPISPSFYSSNSLPSPTTSFGLLRCYSPSMLTTNNNTIPTTSSTSLTTMSTVTSSTTPVNNYSPSPSPTRKLFITKRSMSPINFQLKPTQLTQPVLTTAKRKCKLIFLALYLKLFFI